MGKRIIPCVNGGFRQPFAAAVRVGNLVFMSGCAGIEPETGYIPSCGVRDPERPETRVSAAKAQTEIALKSIKKTLEELGSSLESIVKITLYIPYPERDKKDIVETLHEYIPNLQDVCRTTIYGIKLFEDLLVEIEAWAIVPDK